jgi:hypothetical protein
MSEAPWDAEYRLPSGLHVEHYELQLRPALLSDTFTGSVRLDVRLSEPLAYLPLHQYGLSVSNVRLSDGVQLRDFFDAPKNQFVVLRPTEEHFHLDFEGSLRQPDIVGLYSSHYTDPSGQRRCPKIIHLYFNKQFLGRKCVCRIGSQN